MAERILRDRAAIEGERRTVTVLSVDAVGSTPMAERLDDEAFYAVMRGCVARMIEAVHRYEGTAAQFLGDGLLALFGAPIAHEDAARRAVAAAVEMQRSLHEYAAEAKRQHAIECRFRIGLNTGPVIVGKIGDDLSMGYTAIGDTTNLAVRLQQLADPDAIYMSEHTHRAVRDYFECEPLGALAVKGKAAPITAYRALGEKSARTRFEAATEHGLTPYVGRGEELTILRSYLDKVRRGQGQVVFVSGEAGIGKSRLLLEFRRSIQPEPTGWLEGHCITYGRNIPYLPIIDLVKRTFGVEETDDEVSIVRRVDGGTAHWDAAAGATVPYLKYLLSVDPGDPAISRMDPRERRAGIFDGLRALVLQESRRSPLVVVVEDLHWVDEMSEEALAALAEVIPQAPVLLVLTHRPGYTHSLGERAHFTRLALGELRPEESAAVAAAVLQAASLPEQLERLIVSKAEGNPFFVEEVTKSLVETGFLRRTNGTYTLARPVEQIRIPDTIQDVILSRIDRLERREKGAIQLASVIGREFTLRLLERISDVETELDETLGELKALELIYEKSYFPELAYMFKHALTQEMAQSTLLLERRKALHRIVAAAIEELYADRLAEQYETLAHHFDEGEEWEKALDYLVKAGDKAAASNAHQDALDFYARALEVCQKLGDPALAVSAAVARSRGLVNQTIGDFRSATADFDRMLAAGRERRDGHTEGMALVHRGLIEYQDHAFARGEETLRTALAVVDERFDDVRLFANIWLGMMFLVIGRHSEFEPLVRAAEELLPRVEGSSGQAWCAIVRAYQLGWAGRFDGSLEILQRWRVAAEGSFQTRLRCWWWESLMRTGKGEYERALALLEDVLSTCRRTGETYFHTRALNTVGWVYSELQDHQRALDWNTRGVRAAHEMRAPDPECEINARLNLGDNLVALGRPNEAEEHFQYVERVVRDPRPKDHWALWRYSQHFFHSRGELCLLRDDHARALTYADECLALAEQSDSRKNIVKALRLRGQALLARRQPREAEPELTRALDVARQVGNPLQLWKTLAALGDLRRAQGRADEAGRAYRGALAVVEGVAAGLTDERRGVFLDSPHVHGIRRQAGEAG
ncbi:MAG TPA: AAA family ATPase [Chloroflexota bacterium]